MCFEKYFPFPNIIFEEKISGCKDGKSSSLDKKRYLLNLDTIASLNCFESVT